MQKNVFFLYLLFSPYLMLSSYPFFFTLLTPEVMRESSLMD